MNKQGSAIIVLLIVVVVILAIICAIWHYEAHNSTPSQMLELHNTTTTLPIQVMPTSTISTSTETGSSSSSTAWLASIRQTSPEVVSIPSSSSIPEEVQGKIAFTQNGEVWVADDDGSSRLQLTHTNSNVSDNETGAMSASGSFSFSPDFHYLEYYIVWPTGSRSYASGTIAILNLDNNQLVQQINGWTLNQFSAFSSISQYQTPYVTFDSWVDNSQFIFDAWGLDGPGGGADEYGKLLVDLQKGTTTVIQPQ